MEFLSSHLMKIQNKFKLLLVLFLSVTVSSCATAIEYKVDRKMYRPERINSYKCLVDVMRDLRSENERNGTVSSLKGYAYTKDEFWKKDIGMQVSKTLVKHMEKVRLFSEVVLQDVEDDLINNDYKIQALLTEGYDFALTCDLHSFYGYMSGAGAKNVASVFGSALALMIVSKTTIGGQTVIGDIKIIDLNKREILHEGEIVFDFEESIKMYKNPMIYAIRALKGANNKYIQKIDEVIRNRRK